MASALADLRPQTISDTGLFKCCKWFPLDWYYRNSGLFSTDFM